MIDSTQVDYAPAPHPLPAGSIFARNMLTRLGVNPVHIPVPPCHARPENYIFIINDMCTLKLIGNALKLAKKSNLLYFEQFWGSSKVLKWVLLLF